MALLVQLLTLIQLSILIPPCSQRNVSRDLGDVLMAKQPHTYLSSISSYIRESTSLLSEAAPHTTLLSFLELCAPLAEERRSPAPTPAEVIMVEARP